MPATSRSAESGRTRSASGSAGSPSKSISSQPRGVRRVWPEVQVAVHPLGRHPLGRARPPRRRWPGSRRRTARARAPRRPWRPAARARRRRARGRRARSRPAPGAARRAPRRRSRRGREASPAKSPPTSSARRSASASRSRTLARAMDQPSAELAAKSCSIASVNGSPSNVPSTAPCSAATSSLSTDRSARCTSRSGLRPGSTRRNSLRIERSPHDTEVFDCSTPSTRPATPLGDLRVGLGDEPQAADRAALPERVEQPFGDAQVPQPVVGHQPVDRAERDVLQLAARSGGAADEQLVVVLAPPL